MCKDCRDEYQHDHPNASTLKRPPESQVYEQGPREVGWAPRRRRRRRLYYGFGYRDHGGYGGYDESDDYGTSSDDEVMVKVETRWKNSSKPSSKLNQTLIRGRRAMIVTLLGQNGLRLRADSKLCNDFIAGTPPDPVKVTRVMVEMAWYFASTSYASLVLSRIPSESAKAKAVASWAESESRALKDQPIEDKIFEHMRNPPPLSLRPACIFALGILREENNSYHVSGAIRQNFSLDVNCDY